MHLHMRVFYAFFSLIAAPFVIPASGQTVDEKGLNGIDSGVWALQFRITGNFNLGSFQGSVLSAKYHFRPNEALRFGVSFLGQTSDTERTSRTDIVTDDSNGRRQTGNDQVTTVDLGTYNLGLELQYVHYPSSSREVLFFWGAGPSVAWSRNETEQKTELMSSQIMSVESEKVIRRTREAGGQGLLGAEWFATRRISLTAEYGFAVTYFWTREEGRRETVSTQETSGAGTTNRLTEDTTLKGSGWRLTPSLVRFGLTLYL